MKARSAIRTAFVAGATGGLLITLSPSAVADHTHAKVVGNGQCVVLAGGAGEEAVVLPLSVFENNPNVDIAPTASRMHPLHVLVMLRHQPAQWREPMPALGELDVERMVLGVPLFPQRKYLIRGFTADAACLGPRHDFA